MKSRFVTDQASAGPRLLKICCYILLIFEVLLGIAHLLWPEYQWGQGRSSYFNFNNTLTLVSWLASMQLLGVTVFSLIGFHRERHSRDSRIFQTTYLWLLGALMALALSIAEVTRFHRKLELLGFPNPDIYEQFVIFSLWAALLILFGWILLQKLRNKPGYNYSIGWLTAWGLELFFVLFSSSTPLDPNSWPAWSTFVIGLTYLFGCTFLLMALGGFVLQPNMETRTAIANVLRSEWTVFPDGSRRILIFLGVGGAAFTIIFLQIILFQMLTIFGGYITAKSVISIALLGISVGGLIGWRTPPRMASQVMIGASLLLPVTILTAFGAVVSLMSTPIIASILLMLPFVCGGTVIAVALAWSKTHLVYFVDLSGAAIGAVFVTMGLSAFREESSLLFLIAFAFLLAGCFIVSISTRRARFWLALVMFAGFLFFLGVGQANLQFDWLNIVRAKITGSYPTATVLFSRSSYAGRYDVIRRKPTHRTLSTYENGRVIDTLRKNPVKMYQIDPRLPHTLMKNPVILVLGLSGDGISKTAKALGKKVYGVEINPAIVRLQKNELVEFNANSYGNIEVAILDGRSFLEQTNQLYDFITLMNTHTTRGRTVGRSPSPEYLHTREAIESYLRHLTERGVIIVEEVVNWPRRELPVWKLLVTMRQVLIDRGYIHPERHFFIFQWRTKTNNYIQILMKKNPFTKGDIANLKKWLQDVDDIKKIEGRTGRRMGPIRAKTTILHSPGERFSTNYTRILKGTVDHDFLQSRNLFVTTDDRPFHFDVNPARPELKTAFVRTLLIAILLLPFFLIFLIRYRSALSSSYPYFFVAALSGMGYFLIEIVLIQRYVIFLGSPIVTFSTILGTLLIFSGFGSLWSRHIGKKGVYGILVVLLSMLILHLWWIPPLFSPGAFLPLHWKIFFTVVALAPLAFSMGVPFPFVLRACKAQYTESSAGLLFAANAATSALAVPLAMSISTASGLNATFEAGALVYMAIGILLVSMVKKRIRAFANGFAMLVLFLLLIWPWTFGGSLLRVVDAHNQYRVYGVSYGNSFYQENKVARGGSPSVFVPFEWLFWIIKGNGRTILVDTGFDDFEMTKKMGIRNYVQPTKRLRQLGIAPHGVTDVILTHAHWDHIGSLSPYKNARIWIQETEYRHARSVVGPKNPVAQGMRWQDIEILLLAEKEGRLRLVRGEKKLIPGITMTMGGDHTPGSQYVTVDTLDGPAVIAGDSVYVYRNSQRHVPIGSAVDQRANLITIRKMHRRAASPFLILPGHDPLVMRWFPRVSRGIVQITTIPE